MKQNILYLIEDEIMLTRLTTTLRKINIEADSYTVHNMNVIFDLIKIPQDELIYSAYLKMIESGSDLEKYNSKERIEQLSEEVYGFLLKFSELKSSLV
jgi:hypothetical protein